MLFQLRFMRHENLSMYYFHSQSFNSYSNNNLFLSLSVIFLNSFTVHVPSLCSELVFFIIFFCALCFLIRYLFLLFSSPVSSSPSHLQCNCSWFYYICLANFVQKCSHQKESCLCHSYRINIQNTIHYNTIHYNVFLDMIAQIFFANFILSIVIIFVNRQTDAYKVWLVTISFIFNFPVQIDFEFLTWFLVFVEIFCFQFYVQQWNWKMFDEYRPLSIHISLKIEVI